MLHAGTSALTGLEASFATGSTKSFVHRASLLFVWLAFLTSGVVFSEPAPVDALLAGLVILLPAVGLMRLTPALVTLLGLWLIIAASMVLSATLAPDLAKALKHTGISVFLSVAAVVIAGFVAARPKAHTTLILDGWLWGGMVAALAGLAGYFSLIDGAYDLFTRYDRATGPFKDPNVFGPYLVVPMLYALHLGVARSTARAAVALPLAAILALACLVSFSRGAWANMLVAIAIWAVLTLITSGRAVRQRMVLFGAAGTLAIIAVIAIALQTEQVASLLAERASLVQSYDGGPEGRFGGQMKALNLIATHPLGIGALTFAPNYHHEEAHSVYLSMMMNAGWLGGGLFLLVMIATLAVGLKAAVRGGPAAPLLAIAVAAFTGNVLEGWIIDTDHWRHLYLEMALVWGLAVGAPCAPNARAPSTVPVEHDADDDAPNTRRPAIRRRRALRG